MERLVPEAPAVTEVDRLLRLAAAEARRQWQEALAVGDFSEVDRWVHTAQAVHQALVSLVGDYSS